MALSATPSSSTPVTATVNPPEWLKLLAEGKFPELCKQMIEAIDVFSKSTFTPPDPKTQVSMDLFANLLLFIFTQPYFKIPDEFADRFVGRNHAVANIVANSHFKNTDIHLEMIRAQQANYLKVLTLYSARNTVEFDRNAIFGVNALLSSLWYMQFAEMFHTGYVSAVFTENLRKHFEFTTNAMVPVFNLQEPYFGSSYINTTCERTVKKTINETVQRACSALKMSTNPRNPRKIAIPSTYWRRNHSVYRNYSQFFDALRPKYHLTFLQIGRYTQQHTEGFDECRTLESNRGLIDPMTVINNDFQMFLYPDIGMTCESVLLANLRLAPIQAAMLGHSVSTFGGDIDFFFSGARVEVPDAPEKNYSERLVLLPNMGVIHNLPLHTPQYPPKPTDRMFINCPWQTHKINHGALQSLARIIKRATRPICFRFYIGAGSGLYNDHPTFVQEILSTLGPENCEILGDMPYGNYMALMEQGLFSLDSWHFGGCNTVSDSLFIRVPIVCRDGERWYNRIGPQMLRTAGFPELVVNSDDEYVDLAHRLIHDDPWRDELTRRLQATDLNSTIYSREDVEHFVAAVDYLMENHEQLKASGDRSPLRFPLAK